MKRLPILVFLLAFTTSFSQTLVNQTVPDTMGIPSHIYEYTKLVPIGNGNFAVLDNDYNSAYWPSSQGFNLAEINPSTGLVGGFNFFSQHGEGDYGTNLSIYNGYLYAVGVTTDSLFNNSISCNLYKVNLSTFDTVFTLSMSIDSAVQQAPFSVLADDSGYIYMGASVQTVSGYKIALLKFDSIGHEIWESSWDTSGWYTLPVAMAFSGGYINITGFSFDGLGHSNFLSLPVNSHTGSQLLPRLSANGIGTVSHPIGIVPDTSGNSYIAGTSTVAGITSVVKVVAYDNSFSQLWVSTYGDSSQTNTAASMCGDQSHIYVTGTSPNTSGGTNLTVMKFNNADGSLAWSRTLSAPNPANGMSGVGIATSNNTGSIYVTGTVYNGVDTNIVTAAYDSGGNLLWEKTFARTGSSTDVPYSITTGDGGTPVYVTARSYASDSLYIMLEYDEDRTYFPIDSGAAIAYSYYQNTGQILNDSSKVASNVLYYTNFGHPQMYFGYDTISYVFATAKGDTSQMDSIQRIDMVLKNTTSGSGGYTIYSAQPQKYGTLNYFLGALPSPITNVQANSMLVYKSVYSDIDFQAYSDTNGFKYYYIIYPGATSSNIDMLYNGASSVLLSSNALTITSQFGQIQQTAVTAWQANNNSSVSISYNSLGTNEYGFNIGSYDKSQILVIEVSQLRSCNPASISSFNGSDWSTFFGGNGFDEANDISVNVLNASGVYITGVTSSYPFPNISGLNNLPEQGSIAASAENAFIAGFGVNGTPNFTTYYGGSFDDEAKKIAFNSNNDVYIVGQALSSDLPIVPAGNSSRNGNSDGFIAHFNSTCSQLIFARYFGGNGDDIINSIAIDGSDNVYLVGTTESSTSSFPVQSKSGAFNQLTTSANLSAPDAFIAEFNNSNVQQWGTFFGGSGEEYGTDIKLDASGNIYIAGTTGTTALASTVSGNTPCGVPNSNSDFPDCNPGGGAFHQSALNDGDADADIAQNDDAFIAEFSSSGAMLWSTFFGGTGHEIGGVASELNIPFKVALSINPLDNTQIVMAGTTSFSGPPSPAFPPVFTGSQYEQTSVSPDINYFMVRFTNKAQSWFTPIGTSDMRSCGVTYDNRSNFFQVGENNDGVNTYSSTTCTVPSSPASEMPDCSPSGTFFQPSYGGGSAPNGDGVIIGMSATEELIWSTYYGGDGADEIFATCFDNVGSWIYICGRTMSNCNYPLLNPNTGNYMQSTNAGGLNNLDAFIGRFKLNFTNVGIKNVQKNNPNLLSVYPNPSNNKLYVNFDDGSQCPLSCQIIDVTGQVLENVNLQFENTNVHSININNLSDGMYIIKVASQTAKFIKSE
jgi:hypothetical protein